MANDARVFLLYPPLTDPTSGYHSLSYIDSYARHTGLPGAEIVDANIEAFHYSLLPEEAGLLALDYAATSPRNPTEEAAHWRASGADARDTRTSVSILQNPELFYDYPTYRWAVERVVSWMQYLSATGVPGSFGEQSGFRFGDTDLINWFSIKDLRDPERLQLINRPFRRYVSNSLLPRLDGGTLIGVNITYQEQLPFALYIIDKIRDRYPDVEIVVGGTEVSAVYKYLPDKIRLFEVFDRVDFAIVGEGESAYEEVLREHITGQKIIHPNVFHNGPSSRLAKPLLAHYEPIKRIPAPSYTPLPWDQYLSPSRYAYYSPTRGCYWNKCTFCDYGLNFDSPTSPWRQNSVDKMVADAWKISQEAEFFYFSVDVLAPAAMLRFAERVKEEQIPIKWGAEIRLEHYWSPERCQTLREGGCIVVSVGYEAGTQRVLDLIDKGTTPDGVADTIKHLHEAGIGVEMMGFTGFPSETFDESLESINFLKRNREYWTFGGMGEFLLTAGSMIAKEPSKYGITDVAPRDGDDILSILNFRDTAQTKEQKDAVTHQRASLQSWPFARPWLGGIDTPHTYFYHDKFGTKVLDEMRDSMMRGVSCSNVLWLNGRVCTDPSSGRRVFVHADTTSMDLPAPLLSLLLDVDGSRPFEDVCASHGLETREQVQRLLQQLMEAHILHTRSPEHMAELTRTDCSAETAALDGVSG